MKVTECPIAPLPTRNGAGGVVMDGMNHRGLEMTFVECEGHSFRVDKESPPPEGLR